MLTSFQEFNGSKEVEEVTARGQIATFKLEVSRGGGTLSTSSTAYTSDATVKSGCNG